MKCTLTVVTGLLLAGVACQASSQAAPAPAKVLPAAEAPGGVAEPQVIHQVTEDDKVRIEELRVRGQTRRLTVQPKVAGMSAYEILPPEPGRAPTQDPKAGQRVWWSLDF